MKQQLIAIADIIVDFVDFENIRKAVIYEKNKEFYKALADYK